MNGEQKTNTTSPLVKALSVLILGMRRMWWFALILTVSLSLLLGYREWSSYVPLYTASETFSVYIKNESQAQVNQFNTGAAEQMAKTFPNILKSGMLSDLVKADLNVDYLPEIRVEAQEGINLITLSVTGTDPKFSYDVLQSVVENYPQVSEFVVGPTELVVIDESGVPDKPDNLRTWQSGAKRGALVGFGISMLVVLFYGYTKATVMGREDLARTTNARYLGSLPEVNVKRRSSRKVTINVNTSGDANYKEAFRSLSVRIDQTLREKKLKAMMICSASSGEGKTTVSYNLAMSLANIHRKVLLIDCDIRKPSLNSVLNMGEWKGITDIACDGEDYESLIYRAENDKIDVIFAGNATTETSELLSSGRMETLMSELREKYDYILVDTPPCSILSDAEELAEIVDCAVMVVKQNYSSLEAVVDGLKRLSESGVNVIGYILNSYGNGISSRAYGYGYGYGYGKYGYGYGYGYGSGYEYGKYGYGNTDSGDKE